MIFLSPRQEKNLYGLGFDEDKNDLMEMNLEKMELAYVVPGKKTPSLLHLLGSCGVGMGFQSQ